MKVIKITTTATKIAHRVDNAIREILVDDLKIFSIKRQFLGFNKQAPLFTISAA